MAQSDSGAVALYESLARFQWWRARRRVAADSLDGLELRKRLVPPQGGDGPADGAAGLDTWLQAVAGGCAGARVLDLGCGFGASLLRAVDAGAREGVGLTPSPYQIARARSTAAARGVAARCRFEVAGLDAPLASGLDGCGAPTLLLSLRSLAAGFCSFANHERLGAVRSASCRTIFEAVGAAPELLAGEQRLCTALVRQWPGRAFAKNGAEGVYVMALQPDPRRVRFPGAIGIAVKADDGAERGYQPVVVDLLRWLDAFDGQEVPAPLQRFWRVPISNTQKVAVGEVRAVVDWEGA